MSSRVPGWHLGPVWSWLFGVTEVLALASHLFYFEFFSSVITRVRGPEVMVSSAYIHVTGVLHVGKHF